MPKTLLNIYEQRNKEETGNILKKGGFAKTFFFVCFTLSYIHSIKRNEMGKKLFSVFCGPLNPKQWFLEKCLFVYGQLKRPNN